MRKILVFGGSFDPPHLGHCALLLSAAKTLRPDGILIIPAYRAPLKNPAGASAAHRLKMIHSGLLPSLPASWRRITRLDLSEINGKRRVYTVETLRRLKRLHPKAELHFAVGSDSAADFHRWRDPESLKTLSRWWAANRPGHFLAARDLTFFKRLRHAMPDISSTEIRSRLALGDGARKYLAPAVHAFIKRHGLYGENLPDRLKTQIKSRRFKHSLAVARLAEQLARRWGLDPAKARLAGLLHDCGRSIPAPDMAGYAQRRRLAVPFLAAVSRRQPLLCHAYVSADIARRRFGVSDPAILSAISKHTLGGRSMSALDRLIYTADAASTDRNYPEAKKIRALAFQDIDAAFRACVRQKLCHALSHDAWIHPLTLQLWNSLQK
ncbi:MAG: hypothetical protein A3J74_00865 [Elusimicrobia bacterium RIFCSPHIGHO2_02_FULL_57_9]|nr:MAG: hypothetical protein A3J74_00865 [Elusimicrobia bacterium RIFCSPHIGHO2_02_FULL_57_9]